MKTPSTGKLPCIPAPHKLTVSSQPPNNHFPVSVTVINSRPSFMSCMRCILLFQSSFTRCFWDSCASLGCSVVLCTHLSMHLGAVSSLSSYIKALWTFMGSSSVDITFSFLSGKHLGEELLGQRKMRVYLYKKLPNSFPSNTSFYIPTCGAWEL